MNDDEWVAQIEEDFEGARLSPQDEVMLDYVARLTQVPPAVDEHDVQALRAAGFSDRTILDIAQITAYFAFVTRMAEGLGVSLEETWFRE